MRLNTRLQRLEQRIFDPGCPACRDRSGVHVLVNARRMPDGMLMYPDDDKPKPCEMCGEVPEHVTTLILQVVETREDIARLDAERWNAAM